MTLQTPTLADSTANQNRPTNSGEPALATWKKSFALLSWFHTVQVKKCGIKSEIAEFAVKVSFCLNLT